MTEDRVTADELKRLMELLCDCVRLAEDATIGFAVPTEDELIEAGAARAAARRLLEAGWLAEMVTDVRETADFCDPEDPPERVLEYARDVVAEYLRKRYPL